MNNNSEKNQPENVNKISDDETDDNDILSDDEDFEEFTPAEE